MLMFSFGMLNIKMILYEQNVTLRLSLIDRNNAKKKPTNNLMESIHFATATI